MIRWTQKNLAILAFFVSILSLCVTVIIGLLTVREARRTSVSQATIVSGVSSQRSDNSLKDNRLTSLVVCRTELYISNRGGSEALIEILESNLTPDFFP